MTRGKYAAKAANRMAQIDSEIVADLRAQLATAVNERDEARREAKRLQDKLATDVNRAARDLSDARIAEVSQDLVAERKGRAEDRKQLGHELFAVFQKFDAWPKFNILADIASVFGLSDEIGEVVRPLMAGNPGNRHARRLNAGRLRALEAFLEAKERRA